MKDNSRKIAISLSKFYLRLGRGHALIDFIIVMIKNIVYLGALGYLFKSWFGFDIPVPVLIGIGVLFEVFCYTLGYVDEKLGFWKFQNSYLAKDLNPYGEEVLSLIKNIHEKTNV